MATDRRSTEERRQQIAEAALRILATKGARRLTAAALATDVGIADGTIFRHFKDKNEIVQAAIDLFGAKLETTFPPADLEPLERLGSFVVKRLTLVRRNPELLRLAFTDRLAEAAGEDGAQRIMRIVGRSLEFLRQCLVEAQDRQEVARDVPATLLVWMIIGVIHGASASPIQRVAGEKRLFRARPSRVWEAIERLLRSTGGSTPGGKPKRIPRIPS